MITTLRKNYQKWLEYKARIKSKNGVLHFIVDTGEAILFALVMALLIRQFIVQVSVVPSPSMVPTLMVGDRLFVNKLIYRIQDPTRGEIIVFKSPYKDNKDYVKRCVGLPGDHFQVTDGEIYVNGKLVVFAGSTIKNDHSYYGPILIPGRNYIMMGDNRSNSWDSRYWGTVPREDIEGKAVFTFWPFSRMRPLK